MKKEKATFSSRTDRNWQASRQRPRSDLSCEILTKWLNVCERYSAPVPTFRGACEGCVRGTVSSI